MRSGLCLVLESLRTIKIVEHGQTIYPGYQRESKVTVDLAAVAECIAVQRMMPPSRRIHEASCKEETIVIKECSSGGLGAACRPNYRRICMVGLWIVSRAHHRRRREAGLHMPSTVGMLISSFHGCTAGLG